jgi:hypothetical protein
MQYRLTLPSAPLGTTIGSFPAFFRLSQLSIFVALMSNPETNYALFSDRSVDGSIIVTYFAITST